MYIMTAGPFSRQGAAVRPRVSQRGREKWYVLVLPARQGAAVRPRVSQRGREQWYVLVLPARQGAVVRVSSPSAAGSSGTC